MYGVPLLDVYPQAITLNRKFVEQLMLYDLDGKQPLQMMKNYALAMNQRSFTISSIKV